MKIKKNISLNNTDEIDKKSNNNSEKIIINFLLI